MKENEPLGGRYFLFISCVLLRTKALVSLASSAALLSPSSTSSGLAPG